MDDKCFERLSSIAAEVRRDIVNITYSSGKNGAHIGGSLSCVEILVALYMYIGIVGKHNAEDEYRNRFILSKAHAAIALYAILKQVGLLSDSDIKDALKKESMYHEHPQMNSCKGIEISGGSLGQGLSIAAGMGLGLRKKGNTKSEVFALLGDGECYEGQIWEAASTIVRYNLTNVTVIIDNNKLKFDDETGWDKNYRELRAIWKSFGFEAFQVDGHDLKAICEVLCKKTSTPKAIIADTVKGKGISFIENKPEWHSNYLNEDMYHMAIKELS